MSMTAQLLLGKAPPLPPVYPPGQHGNVFRRWFDGDRFGGDYNEPGCRLRESTIINRKNAQAFVKKHGACSLRQLAEHLNILQSNAHDYALWMEDKGVCTIDRTVRPIQIRAKGEK